MDRPTETYHRQIILKCTSGATGKSTFARLLAFALDFRSYISLERFPTNKRRQSMMYFLSKIKRQVVILDLVRARFSKIDQRSVKKKVALGIEREFDALDNSEKDTEFLKKLLAPRKYEAQVIKAKEDILRFARKRLVAETRNATALGSIESEKMRAFLELFMQGLTVEERYFFRHVILQKICHRRVNAPREPAKL